MKREAAISKVHPLINPPALPAEGTNRAMSVFWLGGARFAPPGGGDGGGDKACLGRQIYEQVTIE